MANDKVYNVPSLFDKNKESAEFFRKVYAKTNLAVKTKIVYSKNGVGKLEKLKLLLEQEESNKEEDDIFDSNVDLKWLSSALQINQIKIKSS